MLATSRARQKVSRGQEGVVHAVLSLPPPPLVARYIGRSHCTNQQTEIVARAVKMKLSFILRIFLIRISTTSPSSIVYRRPWCRLQRKPDTSFWTRCESVGLRFQRTKSRNVGIDSFRHKFDYLEQGLAIIASTAVVVA